MKKKYIVEIEKAIEIRTDSTYLTPNEIEEEIASQRYEEFFNVIATVETLDEARKIFDENKSECVSKQHGRKIEADELRIREANFSDKGKELHAYGIVIIDSYVAMLDGYVLSENKKAVDFELATTYMNDEISEMLDRELPNLYTEQEFFTVYEKCHYKKFGEHFSTAYDLECRKGV